MPLIIKNQTKNTSPITTTHLSVSLAPKIKNTKPPEKPFQ